MILYTHRHAENYRFRVIQTSGRNVYEFNFDRLAEMPYTRWSETSKFQIVDKSDHPPKIIMKSAHANKIDHKYVFSVQKTKNLGQID